MPKSSDFFRPANQGPLANRDAGAGGLPPDRKSRLAACGCCRAAWTRLAPPCQRAVEVAERYADGLAAVDELRSVRSACRRAEQKVDSRSGRFLLSEHVHRVAAPVVTLRDARLVAADMRPWRGDSAENYEVDLICARVFTDVLGKPEGPFLTEPAHWRTAATVSMAR